MVDYCGDVAYPEIVVPKLSPELKRRLSRIKRQYNNKSLARKVKEKRFSRNSTKVCIR